MTIVYNANIRAAFGPPCYLRKPQIQELSWLPFAAFGLSRHRKITVCVTMARFRIAMKTPSTRLAHILIGKSIVETLIVGALAVFTFITVLPPYFHGWAEADRDRDFGLGG